MAAGAIIPLLGLDFADADAQAAITALQARRSGERFAYWATPNADHLVRLARQPELRSLYQGADALLLDSRVVARLAGALRLPSPPVVPGSDLTAALFCQVIGRDDPITVLGGSAETAAALRARFGLSRLRHHNPPMGFDAAPEALEVALQFLEAEPARFHLLAVGSPRQERVAQALRARGRATGLALCIGASLLFLTGEERRAPGLLQRAGLEWAWRLAANPRRLARRYLVDDPLILRLLFREALRHR